MKSILVVVFSFHLATGGVLFTELAKVPFLVQHFQDHQKLNSGICFGQFLWMHYMVNKHRHDDNNKCHSQLPLCCLHYSTAETVVSNLPPAPHRLELTFPLSQARLRPWADYRFPLLEGAAFGIFQPPKLA